MVERSLSMREAPGSIPGLSNTEHCAQTARSAGMILDGSGDGLQIHWSLTRQRFDSSFSAINFLLCFLEIFGAALSFRVSAIIMVFITCLTYMCAKDPGPRVGPKIGLTRLGSPYGSLPHDAAACRAYSVAQPRLA
jgi:hypothetical protein